MLQEVIFLVRNYLVNYYLESSLKTEHLKIKLKKSELGNWHYMNISVVDKKWNNLLERMNNN